MYQVTFKTVAPVLVAAVRHVGPYTEMGKAFERLSAWAWPRGLIGPQTRAFGVYYDNPRLVPPEQCRADACISIAADIEPDGEAHKMAIAGGRYATIVHKGPYAGLKAAYDWLYGTWLPQSGEEPADRPAFEECLNNPRNTPPDELLTEIFLPVR